jgi:hypothetical protein
MKRLLYFIVLITGIIVISSCDYDDSNDIDFITPVDSTATGILKPELP